MSNSNNIALALLDNISAVEVRFLPSGGRYTYLVHDSMQLTVGDHVVVDSPKGGLVVVEVTDADMSIDIDATFEYKFIVCKVERELFDTLKKVQAEARELIKAQRRDTARKAMREQLGIKASLVANLNKGLPKL